MRPDHHGGFVHLQLAVPLFCVLFIPAQTGFAQRITGRERVSLGSTWSRNTYSRPVVLGSGAVSGKWRPADSSKRFFGGITVGRGFHPFYYGYGYAPFMYPSATYPLGRAFCTPGLHISAGNARFDPLYFGSGLALPSYYSGGYSGYIDYPLTPGAISGSLFGSGAHRPPVSHSRINDAARIEFAPTFGRPVAPEHFGIIDFMSIKPHVSAAIEKAPIADEFAPAATDQRHVTTNDRIESQRLQTEGDRALRNADAELARTYYQAAVRAAPNRQTPWLRTAWVHVAQREYPKAAAALNRALLIRNDTGAGWLDADKLLHDSPKDRSWLTDVGLWTWLQHRPGSADRLLLAAGYQFFLGRTQTAIELMELSRAAGISQSSYKALSRVATSRRDDPQTEFTKIPVNRKASRVNAADREQPFSPSDSQDGKETAATLRLPPEFAP